METTPLPYSALAELMGKTVDAVRKIARRRGWRVSLDNRGKALVHVPLADLEDTNPPATPATVEPPATRPPPGGHMDAGALVAALERERDALLARLDAAEREAREARGEAIEARIKLADALARLDERERLVKALEGRGWLGKLLG